MGLSVSLGNIINVRGLFIAIPLVVFAILLVRVLKKRKGMRRQKPGQFLRYKVPGKTAAACRGILGKNAASDLFAYSLQSAAGGGWYLHFTLHNPTGQMLDTQFLLQFEGDDPAGFSLQFISEAFGMKEPVIGEELLDAFFAQKLSAVRLPAGSETLDNPAPE